MRVSDEKEEERFKQLDETIRAYQRQGKGRAEAAATKIPFSRRKIRKKREEAVLTRGTTGIHKALKEKGSGPVLFPQVFRMPLDR